MRRYLLIILCACALVSCRDYQISDDPTLRLSFSTDTLSFDTVFTAEGSATAQLMVYNRNASAILIDRVWLTEGTTFHANIDGEADLSRLNRLQINGGDSMYVFLRVKIDPTGENTPLLVSDQLHFHLATGATQDVQLEAYGQDAKRIGSKGCGRTEYFTLTMTAEKPYIIYDTLIVEAKLTIKPGATLYMHKGACIYVLGDVSAKGTVNEPIVIRGDRLDRLFDSVPYLYAGGSWNGIYLQAETPHNYQFEYVDILSGNIGLYCFSTCTGTLPNLRMEGCRIHNHTLYGLILLNVDALVTNTEISNCASYCVYCAGGTQNFVHTTVASYYGNTNIRLQPDENYKPTAAAVYIDNLSKSAPQTITSFYNSIITGYQKEQLVVATPLDRYYPGYFIGNYLKTDTLPIPNASANVYWQKPKPNEQDTIRVFVNDYYKYKEYVYYDFRPDSLSPVIGIGDSIAALPYPADRNGVSRALMRPDAGCYQHQP